MKRCLALLLAAVLLAGFLPAVTAASAPEPLCFAVASDLHYNLPEETLAEQNADPVFWYANRRAAMENESGFLIDAFLRQCAEDDAVRYVLISGDLADHGRTNPAEHLAVAEKLRAFEARTGKDVFVINGNHDASLNAGDTSFADFRRIYAEFGYDLSLETGEDDCSYTADLGNAYRLIALDSCSATESTEDGMTLRKISWTLRQARQAKADGRQPILMLHHNLLDHLPAQRIVSRNFIVRFHCSTAALFAEAGIRLVLSGHEHCSDAAVFTAPNGAKLYDFATTSLTMYPLAYRVFTVTDETIAYRAEMLRQIDTEALAAAVSGYTPELLAMIDEDPNAYAKGFFKAGVRLRLSRSFTDEGLGVAPGDALYPVLHTAAAGLTAILETPYPALRKTARAYGIDLPETDYADPWDLITDLAAAHYAGEEAYPPTSPAVRLLLRTAALILKTDLAGTADSVLLSAANALLGRGADDGLAQNTAKLCAGVFGGITPGGYFTAALLAPLLYEFANDADGAPDNDGALPNAGAAPRAENLFAAAISLLRRCRLYLDLFLDVLLAR